MARSSTAAACPDIPTVAGTLAAVTMCQGALIEGDGAAAFRAVSGAILKIVSECKGKGKGVAMFLEGKRIHN